MSQKHRRSNRETKKPKQNKAKVVVSTSPFASASSNPAKAIAAKRKQTTGVTMVCAAGTVLANRATKLGHG